MGYIRHHAIIVTGWQEAAVHSAHAEASRLFSGLCEITSIAPSGVNDYWTFLVPPDGSKEGWSHSTISDHARDEFIKWMAERQSTDFLEWAEVQFYDEDGDVRVTRHACEVAPEGASQPPDGSHGNGVEQGAQAPSSRPNTKVTP